MGAFAFAVAMMLRDMSNEKYDRLIKTKKFYQECYSRIASDSSQAFNIVTSVSRKASPCFLPGELTTGSQYLPLYCFYQIIRKQGKVTSEQNKIIDLFFDTLNIPFSRRTYINAAKNGSDFEDFGKVINISKTHAGSFGLISSEL